MRIALDAMGGDHAPQEVIKGALVAAQHPDVEIVLVGREPLIQSQLSGFRHRNSSLSIVDAREVVDPHDSPLQAVRSKPDSSIAVGMDLVKGGEVSAFVSAGSTGAVAAAAYLSLGLMEGVERMALGLVYPGASGTTLLLDVGANADCRPNFLVQFAYMGSTYMERVWAIPRPRVALLSIGEEETKGNRLVQQTHRLLKASSLNFVGNVEGNDLSRGVADVIVTDGFTGNVVLKASEGFGEALAQAFARGLGSKPHLKIASFFLRRALARRLDYSETGGALLLGVNGNVIVAHGRSQAKAIANAIRLARQMVEQGMPQSLMEAKLWVNQ
ncbi:MAG: phosphate acyltransferase PlsX [Dehalococcoidia bacterium]